MEKIKRYGLIGYPLGHSFSKKYFSEKFEKQGIHDTHQYDLFPIEQVDKFKDLIDKIPNLIGLNVTIPHKESVVKFLSKMDESAAEIGAVNTIKITNNGTIGFNTDVIGFEKSLTKFIDQHQINQALILGTGGAGKAIAFVLKKLGFPFYWVSRDRKEGRLHYDDLKGKLNNFQLIVNTTPLGTFPNVDSLPDLPYDELNQQHFLFDLVYNPETTAFMKKGLEANSKVKNGLEMLQLQAEAAWDIWNS